MSKKIKIGVLILFLLYVFFYRAEVYIRPKQWQFAQKENETRVMTGTSLNFIRWYHSYERVGNNLYIKLYLGSYLNFLNKNYGPLYFFSIPEDLNEIEHIYTYDKDGNLVLVYPQDESIESGDGELTENGDDVYLN